VAVTLGKGAATHKMAARVKQPQLSVFCAILGKSNFRPTFVQKALDVLHREK
jgi:hypothetical protein